MEDNMGPASGEHLWENFTPLSIVGRNPTIVRGEGCYVFDTDGHRSRVEHEGADPDIAGRFPVGTRLRVLPNHACATGARHSAYRVIDPGGAIRERPRLHGW